MEGVSSARLVEEIWTKTDIAPCFFSLIFFLFLSFLIIH